MTDTMIKLRLEKRIKRRPRKTIDGHTAVAKVYRRNKNQQKHLVMSRRRTTEKGQPSNELDTVDDAPSHPLNKRPEHEPRDLPLYRVDEIPVYMRDNPYLIGGYRAGYTFKMCLRSIFALHNETMNVWTHMVGALFFVLLALGLFLHVLRPVFSHYLVFFVFSLGCVACLLCSTLFHLFDAHYSEKACRWLHTLDYFGITALVVAGFFPPTYLAFTCHPHLRYVYIGMICVLGSFGLIGPFYNFWTSPEFAIKKMFVYVLLVGSGVVPTIHVLFLLPVTPTAPFVFGIALMMLLYLVGMLIYVFKIPERWFPGRFDIWCHSHSIWHVFVLGATLVHFAMCAGMYRHWEMHVSEMSQC